MMITRFVGMDIHKQYAVVTGVNQDQEIALPNQRVEMADLESWCAGHLTRQDAVVIEVTTNTWAVVEILEQYAGRVVVANPYKTKLIAEAHIKNDKVDARSLAQLLAANFICEVWIPSRKIRQWRHLARHRGRLRQQGTQAKNRIQHMLQGYNLRCPARSLWSAQGRAWLEQQALPVVERQIVTHLLAQVDFLEGQTKEAEQQMARLAHHDPRIARLMQITGIGLYTAFSVVAVLGTIERFPTASKLAGYVGLVPREHQSGRRAYHGHITKTGDRLLRWLLVEAAQAAVHWDPHWRAVHAHIAQRRGYGVAIVAVARKLLVTIWHMLKGETNYYYLRQESYVRKLQNWAYRIGHQHLPAASSKAFVAQQLCTLDLQHLADALVTTGRSARLSLAATGT